MDLISIKQVTLDKLHKRSIETFNTNTTRSRKNL